MGTCIITKRHAPTNTLGARISAVDGHGDFRIYIPFPKGLDFEASCLLAAQTLCKKMGWRELYKHGGSTRDGYVFVFRHANHRI